MVDDQLKKKRYAEEVQSERENRKIDAHMALANEVYAIRLLNKQSAEWTVSQRKTMAMWYKRAVNLPLPTTKQLLLTRFHDTMMRGDAAAPVATAATVPLPHHPLVTPITQQDMMGGPQFQRMIQQLLRKNKRRQDQQEHHQSKNDATTSKKHANDIIISNRLL